MDNHMEKVKASVEKRFRQTFPTAEMRLDIDEPNKAFYFQMRTTSRGGKYPFHALHMKINVYPQINQVHYNFSRLPKQGSLYYDNLQCALINRFDEKVQSYSEYVKDQLLGAEINFMPMDRFVKDVISEIDLYYTLAGVSREQRLAMWEQDIAEQNAKREAAHKAAEQAKKEKANDQ